VVIKQFKMKSLLLVLTLLLTNCNNYGLYDKLADPEATKYSDRLHVFVSSVSTVGDMSGLAVNGCTGSGLTVADCYCQATAKSAGLLMSSTSKFVAFLSSSASDMKCRIVGLTGAGGGCNPSGSPIWYDTNYKPVAQGYGSSVFPGALTSALNTTESRTITPALQAWTGTASTGLISSTANVCTDWTSTAGSGTIGAIGSTTAAWTDNGATQPCANSYPIYCFAVP
jgi:hypothetical protein